MREVKHERSGLDTPGVSVHMGFPNPAADRSLTELDLNQLLIQNSVSTFFMRIDGNEWEDQGIFDRDLVVVDRALTPKKTDLMVWWQTDGFVVGPAQKIPTDCTNWGVVTSVIHRFRT